MGKAAAPPEDLRDAIVSAAASMFARHGYRATTLAEVAAAVGVKKASMYHYISSKEEILITIYGRIFDRIEGAISPIAALDLTPDERLRRMIHAHVEIVAEERDMLTVAFQEESELPERYERVIRRRKRGYEQLFEGVIEQGQREGMFRGADVRTVVYGLLGMCNWMHKWYTPKHGTAAEIASIFALLFESGLAGAGGTRGAWPRPRTVEEALRDLRDLAEQVESDARGLRDELARAEERLNDGLAPHKS